MSKRTLNAVASAAVLAVGLAGCAAQSSQPAPASTPDPEMAARLERAERAAAEARQAAAAAQARADEAMAAAKANDTKVDRAFKKSQQK